VICGAKYLDGNNLLGGLPALFLSYLEDFIFNFVPERYTIEKNTAESSYFLFLYNNLEFI